MAHHGHAAADLRNLHLHRAAFARLREQPGLRRACLSLAERWLADPALQSASPWLQRWRDMLADWSIDRIEAVVLAEETGQALRQCSPLGPALTARERWAALEELNLRPASGVSVPPGS
jgi:hypothetical protein